MIRTVKPGRHRFTPPMWGLKFGRGIERLVVFDASCRYALQGTDQEDWNKLFGVASLLGAHHTSYRFGWRYNALLDMIELSAYVYEDKKRSYINLGRLGWVEIGQECILGIKQVNSSVVWGVDGVWAESLPGKMPWISWRLGPYFGGNQAAPVLIKIDII